MLKSKRIYFIPVFGFLILILITAVLLDLPISKLNKISFFDSIFLATSSVSGTGYSTANLLENYTFFGELFVITAVQIGALGFMIFFAFILGLKNKKIKLSDTLILSNEINFNNYSKVKERAFKIIKYAFCIEGFGAMLLAIRFIPQYGVIKGLWYGIFHSISSFCCAGFDLIGNNSLINYTGDIYFNIVIIALMFLGGLGYFVIEDIHRCIKYRNMHLQVYSKLIIASSMYIIIISTILIKIISPNLTIVQALFSTISARSAGFATIDFGTDLNNASKLLVIILMFIGGAAGSNSGGIRLANFCILVLLPLAVIKDEEIVVFYRKINYQTIKRALTMVIVYIFLIIVGFMILMYTNNLNSIDLLFELVSAFTTNGLGVIPLDVISFFGKCVLIFYMYIGRLGPITFFTLFSLRSSYKNSNIDYADADLML